MRGLLPPEIKNIAETKAIDEARELSCAVIKEIEFLMAVTKKGKTSNNVLAKVANMIKRHHDFYIFQV